MLYSSYPSTSKIRSLGVFQNLRENEKKKIRWLCSKSSLPFNIYLSASAVSSFFFFFFKSCPNRHLLLQSRHLNLMSNNFHIFFLTSFLGNNTFNTLQKNKEEKKNRLDKFSWKKKKRDRWLHSPLHFFYLVSRESNLYCNYHYY